MTLFEIPILEGLLNVSNDFHGLEAQLKIPGGNNTPRRSQGLLLALHTEITTDGLGDPMWTWGENTGYPLAIPPTGIETQICWMSLAFIMSTLKTLM